ncbi:tetratricopeptide repeat protein [Pseudoxanthomonas helianthi]|uniref:Tetratricopeptide repeat protein n=1 Tax=Pseudoxanthomonas helianthi TaxID=1453541 RepID=A0A940X281_9GAMM|nr:tetratricopeptide repeat protein [Pseudoxanthomonas helianthi]
MSDDAPTATGLHLQSDFAPGTVLGGRYRIVSRLGIGGMGVVYRADDLALGVPVALKLLRPELAHRQDVFERFRQELLLARQVSNPHVVRIHDLAQHDGHWLISMDFVDGEPLDKCIDRSAPLPVDDALRIARQIAEGLGAAHAKGVVHRDLKPANVLLDAAGNAYISDFGVARSMAGSGASRRGLTQGGAVVGTPDYLSPEQARGEPPDARSDLYALGLILHEMLAGQLPFAGGTMAEVLAQRMLRAPDSIARARSDLSAWLVRLVDRLLRPQPGHRLQDAQAVIEAIDRRELARDWRGAFGRKAVFAALAIAILAGAGGWLWWQSREAVAPRAAAPVVAPLDRLLVLPLTGSGDTARDIALSVHLRNALSNVPGLAVVDGERTSQALRQLDPGGNAAPDPAALRNEALARRVLQARFVRRGGDWQVDARLFEGSGEIALAGPPAADPLAALRAWAVAPAVVQAFGAKVDLASMPQRQDALGEYGLAVAARERGELAAALSRLRATTTAWPDYLEAWWLQSRVAQEIGEQDQAADAVLHAQRAAKTPSENLRRRLAAQRASIEGDHAAAATEWRALLAATPGDATAELNLARELGAGGDAAGALQLLHKLVARDPRDPRAWFELGKWSILQGQARVAVDDYLTRALVAFKRGRDLYGEAETVNALGVGYGRLGQTGDAVEQFRKAIELRRRLGNRRGEATSLRNLANKLSLGGDFAGAGEALRQARAINQALGDAAGHAAVDNELGLLAEERGDFPEALQSYQRALQTWQQLDDKFSSAEALNSIGFAHYQLGNYADAQVYWQQSAEAYAAIGEESGKVRTLQNLGLLATARGRWNEARRQLQESLALAERQQMQEEAEVSRRNLAELELRQGHLQAAIEHAGKAEAGFRQRDDQRGAVDAGLLHAEALLAANADADARKVVEGLRKDLDSISREQQAIAQWLLAELARRGGDAMGAARRLREARRLAVASGVRRLQLRIDLSEAESRPSVLDALDAPTARLGDAALRMEWLRQHMRRALAAGDAPRAVADYNEAAVALRNGDALAAGELHALGARARAATGDAAGAQAAEARAQQALQVWREHLPATLRAAATPQVAKTETTP